MPHIYILQCADNTLYTGWTTDINRRVATHNAGRGAKYTRYRLPVKLAYTEDYATRKEAMQREHRIKKMSRAQKLALIATYHKEKMMTKLTEIEGIGDVYAEKLQEAGIGTTEALLEAGASPAGRKALAEKTDISPKLLLEWINRADLSRVKGIGEEYADLLEAAGVDTVPELAQRNAANLHAKMVEVNDSKNLVRKTPSAGQVTDWVAQAKELPRVINY